ncbi:hypothetical protein BX600DRAFT_119671 [Xylariales sp. PMI_506]|nr:hypothetical protein BX600DRAFT_119671 [Xylariales sp. PMI_506]
MADRCIYTRPQLESYFDRIALPQNSREFSVSPLSPSKQLEYLTLLQMHHLVSVPFENLTMHYSWHRVVEIDSQHLFEKMVNQPGRGGYCMETNSMLFGVLVSLGFDAYMTGARVYNEKRERYGGFSHCLSLVCIAGVQYAVDVGFGANGSTHPIKMTPGEIQDNISPASVRLRHDNLPQGFSRTDKVWIYEHRIRDGAEWAPLYCFTGTEFLPEDIRAINLSPWTSPSSIFKKKLMCVRFAWDEGVEEGYKGRAINGVVIIDDSSLKLRRNGVVVLNHELQSEEDRIQALQENFGIVLSK